jgi:hypothetical protein
MTEEESLFGLIFDLGFFTNSRSRKEKKKKKAEKKRKEASASPPAHRAVDDHDRRTVITAQTSQHRTNDRVGWVCE